MPSGQKVSIEPHRPAFLSSDEMMGGAPKEVGGQPTSSLLGRLHFLADPAVALTMVAVAVGIFCRATWGAQAPLWLDETFTGAIAAQPTLADVTKQILSDVNAPLYYLIAHVWSLLFGLSNASLRFPALVCGIAAPFICLAPRLGLKRDTRLYWCASMALWLPGITYSQEARGYSLLLCLSAGSTIAFIRLMNEPSLKRAVGWAVIGSLAILTHYYALILVGLQGLTFLALYRARALRQWPASLVFIPTFVWLGIHSRTIEAFADPHIAWYPPLDALQLGEALHFIFGDFVILFTLMVLFVAAPIFYRAQKTKSRAIIETEAPGARIAAFVSVAGVLVVLAIGLWRPSFTDRYLMPFIPGVLLGITLSLVWLQRYWKPAPIAAILVFGGALVGAALNTPGKSNIYNFQTASDALMKAGTKNLVFLWDHPANPAENPSQLAIVGGFFFKRQNVDVDVVPIKLVRGQDPNPMLLAAAARPKSGILWVFDKTVHDTAARRFPPHLAELDPRWRCRDYGEAPVGIWACNLAADTVP